MRSSNTGENPFPSPFNLDDQTNNVQSPSSNFVNTNGELVNNTKRTSVKSRSFIFQPSIAELSVLDEDDKLIAPDSPEMFHKGNRKTKKGNKIYKNKHG